MIIDEDVTTLGAQMGAVARLLLIADFLQERDLQPLLLLRLKTKLEGLLRGRFIYDSRCGPGAWLGSAVPRSLLRPACTVLPGPARAGAQPEPTAAGEHGVFLPLQLGRRV